MRNLIFGINLTIDGCCDHTKSTGDVEIHEYFTDLIRESDLLIYGRKTYQLMVPFWPDIAKDPSGQTQSTINFAQTFNAVDKLVFSRSLSSVEDKNTRLVHTGLEEEIRKLKQAPGKNMMTGGVQLPSQLIQLGLVDEYHIVIHPVIAGEGRRFLLETILPKPIQVQLVSSKTFKSGGMALHYVNA
ncbi:MAG: dihydrofolate reductase family protein [Chitinophagaceae bacterium]|nr:dihydrofolate reductase family protein [Chitinophagaceae bacterium]